MHELRSARQRDSRRRNARMLFGRLVFLFRFSWFAAEGPDAGQFPAQAYLGVKDAKDEGNEAQSEDSAEDGVVFAGADDRVGLAEALRGAIDDRFFVVLFLLVFLGVVFLVVVIFFRYVLIANLRFCGYEDDVDASVAGASFDGAVV